MRLLLLVLIFVSAFDAFSENNPYELDLQEIESAFDNAELVNSIEIHTLLNSKKEMRFSNDTQIAAGLVAIGGLIFTGGLVGALIPVHRYILGTGGKAGVITLGYCCTYGGCGILTLIDGIVLLVDDSSNYIDNGKLIMWLN